MTNFATWLSTLNVSSVETACMAVVAVFVGIEILFAGGKVARRIIRSFGSA